MRTLRQIAHEGRTVIFISHKLEEVRAVADRVTVLRAGEVVAPGRAMQSLSTRDLARLMVGTEISARRAPRAVEKRESEPRLLLDNIWDVEERGLPALRAISLSLGRAEILGVAGVAGNCQHKLATVINGQRSAQQ